MCVYLGFTFFLLTISHYGEADIMDPPACNVPRVFLRVCSENKFKYLDREAGIRDPPDKTYKTASGTHNPEHSREADMAPQAAIPYTTAASSNIHKVKTGRRERRKNSIIHMFLLMRG